MMKKLQFIHETLDSKQRQPDNSLYKCNHNS
jgi:hypothetical protein